MKMIIDDGACFMLSNSGHPPPMYLDTLFQTKVTGAVLQIGRYSARS
jgi:hypothetical protein